jgi:hypothetical protein
MGKHGKHRSLVGWAAAPLFMLGAGGAGAQECRLALVLALDVSSSVDATEDRLQREGLARALLSPELAETFLAAPEAPVALLVYEWSGRYRQAIILEWRLIRSAADLATAADVVEKSIRSEDDFPTALGYALGYAAGRFRDGPACWTRMLDVSGDGINNEGFGPALAYANFPFEGIVVNGLVVGGDPQVLRHYREEVIRGPGAFVEEAADYADYARAMERKLLREVSARAVGRAPQPPGGRPVQSAMAR